MWWGELYLYITENTFVWITKNTHFLLFWGIFLLLRLVRNALCWNETAIHVTRNNETDWHKHCCRRRAISITYSESVSVFLHLFYVTLYCHPWPVWLYHIFSHYLINGKIFRKKLWNVQCVFWFSLQFLFENFLILRRSQGDIIKNIYRSSCKVPDILVRF